MIGTILGMWASIFTGVACLGKKMLDDANIGADKREEEFSKQAWMKLRDEIMAQGLPYPYWKEEYSDFRNRAEYEREKRIRQLEYNKEHGIVDEELERLVEIDTEDLVELSRKYSWRHFYLESEIRENAPGAFKHSLLFLKDFIDFLRR